MSSLKQIIKNSVRKTLEAFNIHLISSPEPKINKYHQDLLGKVGINTVVDVGANRGQFGLKLMREGFKGRVISFEPLSDVYNDLLSASAKFANWKVYDRCAIGSEEGEIEINVSENMVSSSIYPILETCTAASPTATIIKQEKVKIHRLDNVLKFDKSDKVHLKIDVQGYEKEVLDGAKGILEAVLSLELELSLIPLYEGAIEPEVLLAEIKRNGFSPVAYVSAFNDKKSGGILQLDGLFVKNNLVSMLD